MAQYSRRRNRLKVLGCLLFLLFVVAIVYLEINKDSLLVSYKNFIEEKMKGIFKTNVSIESLDGGIFRGITIKGLVFYGEAGGKQLQMLKIERARISSRLWDILLYRLFKDREIKIVMSKGEVFLPGEERPSVHGLRGSLLINQDSFQIHNLKATVRNLPVKIRGGISWRDKSPRMDFYSEFENRYTRGLVKVYGMLKEPHIGGYIIVFDKPYDFSGDIFTYENGFRIKDLRLKDEWTVNGELDTRHNRYSLNIMSWKPSPAVGDKKGEINIVADFKEQKFLVHGKIDHVDIGNFDVLTEIELTGEIFERSAEERTCEGNLTTSNTIVNYTPFREFKGHYKLSRDAFTLSSLKFGEEYILSGKVSLTRPFLSSLSLEVKGATTSDLIVFLSDRKPGEEVLSGNLNGNIKLDGTIRNLKGKGHLESSKGNIGTIRYESANINVDILGPIVTVRDSRIYMKEGYRIIEGEIDIRRLGKANALKNVRVVSDEKTMMLSGWDIAKKDETMGFSLGKDIGEDIHINFKNFMNNDLLFNPNRDKGQQEVELEFKVNGKESLKMRLKEQEETLSLERKYRF
ncbi:MAG: hypothetical protein HZA09_06350 [Nitrospirae bacterium]|nr:hypothetical protein [Nitrospirota bacterium]